MVSARPPPKPKQGRTAYPSAQTYTVGDHESAPLAHSPLSAYAAHDGANIGPISSVATHASTSSIAASSGGLRRKTTVNSRKASVSGSSDQEGMTDREAGTQGLKSWWKSFRDKPETEKAKASGEYLMVAELNPVAPVVFGTALDESLKYASVQISTAGTDGSLYVWGCVPIVVAKCGLYLKEHATEVEGTFRVSGSAKRMKDLQAVFDSPPKYGKNLTWRDNTYTSHDVATIFRRYLTQMPEPIVPYANYHDFRACLTTEPFIEENAIKKYKELIRSLPPANQYLLLYVLDLLSVFAKKSAVNLMTAPNLALIFQPGVLHHPDHAMLPSEHGLSRQVLEFLIEHQDHFLLGMQLGPLPAGLAGSTSTDSPSDAMSSSVASPPAPAAPRLIRADSDLMLPSDSDDDAPEGGYYVHEREEPFARSPSKPLSGISTVIPSAPASRPPRAQPDPEKGEMERSDSDEDAPPGGYTLRSGDPDGGRQKFLARSKTSAAARERRASHATPSAKEDSTSSLRPSVTLSAHGSTGSGASISRRRTAPTRRTKEGEVVRRVRKEKGNEAPV